MLGSGFSSRLLKKLLKTDDPLEMSVKSASNNYFGFSFYQKVT